MPRYTEVCRGYTNVTLALKLSCFGAKAALLQCQSCFTLPMLCYFCTEVCAELCRGFSEVRRGKCISAPNKAASAPNLCTFGAEVMLLRCRSYPTSVPKLFYFGTDVGPRYAEVSVLRHRSNVPLVPSLCYFGAEVMLLRCRSHATSVPRYAPRYAEVFPRCAEVTPRYAEVTPR